jgi:hypothetical protein
MSKVPNPVDTYQGASGGFGLPPIPGGWTQYIKAITSGNFRIMPQPSKSSAITRSLSYNARKAISKAAAVRRQIPNRMAKMKAIGNPLGKRKASAGSGTRIRESVQQEVVATSTTFRNSQPPARKYFLKGSDLLQSLIGTSTNLAGDLLANIPMNPTLLPNSKLNLYASMYEKYRFKKLRVRFATAISTSFGGQLVATFDDDPDSVARYSTTGYENVRLSADHTGGVMWAARENTVVLDATPVNKQWFYTDTNWIEPRTSIQANLLIFQAGVMDTATKTLGQLLLDYEIEFMGDELDEDFSGNSLVLYKNATFAVSTAAQNFSAGTSIQAGSTIPVTLITPTPGAASLVGPFSINLPNGAYRLVVNVAGNTTTPTLMKIIPGIGYTYLDSPYATQAAPADSVSSADTVIAIGTIYPSSNDSVTLQPTPGCAFNVEVTYTSTLNYISLEVYALPNTVNADAPQIDRTKLTSKPARSWDVGVRKMFGHEMKVDDGLTDEQRETLSVASQVEPVDGKIVIDEEQYKQLLKLAGNITISGKSEAKDSDLKSVSSGISFFNNIVGKK